VINILNLCPANVPFKERVSDRGSAQGSHGMGSTIRRPAVFSGLMLLWFSEDGDQSVKAQGLIL
jgi:hypothetical protein